MITLNSLYRCTTTAHGASTSAERAGERGHGASWARWTRSAWRARRGAHTARTRATRRSGEERVLLAMQLATPTACISKTTLRRFHAFLKLKKATRHVRCESARCSWISGPNRRIKQTQTGPPRADSDAVVVSPSPLSPAMITHVRVGIKLPCLLHFVFA